MLGFLGRDESVEELVARGSYVKAAALLRRSFENGRRDPDLRLQLGDVLIKARREKEALPILLGVADELARAGQTGKAIAALKKAEAAEPGRSDVAERLAALCPTPAAGKAPAASASPETTPAPTENGPAVPAIPLFTDLGAEELSAVARALRLLSAEAGDVLVAEGEAGDSLFIVAAGRVKAWVKNPRGHYVEVSEMNDGEFFGEISVLDGTPRTATVTATTRCELLLLDRETLRSLSEAHPRVREILEQMRAQRANSSLEAMVRRMKFGSA